MTTTEVFNLFLLVSALHGFAFCIFLYFSKNGKEKSMRYLNLTVLALSLNNFQSWLLTKNIFIESFWGNHFQIPWHFLIAPFFYMFLIRYLDIANRSYKILRIIIPLFLLFIIFQVTFIAIYSNSFLEENSSYILEKYTSIEEIISFLISIIVFSYSFYILVKKEKLFSILLSFDNLKWIYTFFIFGLIGYFLWFFALIIKVQLNFTGFLFSYYPLRIYTTILIYWIGYQSIIQLQLLKERKKLRTSLISIKKDIPINDISKKVNREFTEITHFIIENKKFTEPKITLQILSDQLGISSAKISEVIKSESQKTFIDYMNELRVEQAKKLLVDHDFKNYTTTAIGLESGFNSKSSFYAVFKKHTGKTPAEYKKEVIE